MEEGNFIRSDELRVMRISGHRLKLGQDLLVDDRLESEGILRIHEYTGGCMYIEPKLLKDAPVVAGIKIVKGSGSEARVEKVSCEYGHGDLKEPMIEQAAHFADFYDCSLVLPDFGKVMQEEDRG